MNYSRRVVLVLFLLSGIGMLSAAAAEVKVFAAASLTDVMQAIATKYESQSGDKIVFNFAGSNVLSRQIVQGAPADLFLSADEAEMDAVAKPGLLVNNSRQDLLSNTLVIIVPKESRLSVQDPGDLAKPDFKRIALADPETVPAGVYAKAYLEKKGVWTSLQNKVIPTENVRAALAAVSSGNADAGIVYKTDALISKSTKVAYEIAAGEGPRILYPIALVKGSGNPQQAEKFLKYLESPDAAAIFAQYGFSLAGR
jgi:molybdate transport system substrate-binding protein